MKAVILCALVALAPAARAETTPWKALGQKLIQRENYSNDFGQYQIAHVVPNDRAQPRQADYLTCPLTTTNPDGSVEPLLVRAISETWARAESGHWLIDQWLHEANRAGELQGITHIVIEETDDGIVVGTKYLKPGPVSDPAEQARWQAVLARWYATLP